MSWTEEKVNKLKELWGKGNTANQIAGIAGFETKDQVMDAAIKTIQGLAAAADKVTESYLRRLIRESLRKVIF